MSGIRSPTGIEVFGVKQASAPAIFTFESDHPGWIDRLIQALGFVLLLPQSAISCLPLLLAQQNDLVYFSQKKKLIVYRTVTVSKE